MGYIQDFEGKLTELLAGVDETTRTNVLTYVKRTVVESYKNGIEAGKAASVVRAVGVSANRLYGFERFFLQSVGAQPFGTLDSLEEEDAARVDG
jgi:hypothetical protein